MAAEISISSHKLSLAREFLDDLELARLTPENLMLKGRRLARLMGNEDIGQWLFFELAGFVPDHAVSLKYMVLSGRMEEQGKAVAFWDSLPQLDAQINLYRSEVQKLQIPHIVTSSSGNPPDGNAGTEEERMGRLAALVERVFQHLHDLNARIARLIGIRSKVLALLHDFVSRTYYEICFATLQETLFERQRKLVEARLASTLGSTLEKMPELYDRLARMVPGAVREALSACRQIIEAFADSIYPPTQEVVEIDGKKLPLAANHHLNRITAFVHQSSGSLFRRQRIRRSLDDLYARVSTEKHQDVSEDEARFLLLQTFMLTGEILLLPQPSGPKSEQS